MEKRKYIKFKDEQEKRKYSYKITTSILIDQIMKDNYNLSISTPEITTVKFENRFDRISMGAVYSISDRITNLLPDEMPKVLYNPIGFNEAKKITYRIYKEMIEKEQLETYVNSVKRAIYANDPINYDIFASMLRETVEDKQPSR